MCTLIQCNVISLGADAIDYNSFKKKKKKQCNVILSKPKGIWMYTIMYIIWKMCTFFFIYIQDRIII